jgi:hypothetical protein
MARAGDRGDGLGSRTIAARLVEIAVHLAFTLSRTWQPYSKWRGSMSSRLAIAEPIAADLQTALAASQWQDRSDALREVLEHLAIFQSEVGLPACSPVVVPFWNRPYLQIEQSLVPRLMDSIADPTVRELSVGLGGIDQRTANVDILVSPEHRSAATNVDGHQDLPRGGHEVGPAAITDSDRVR